MIWVFDVNLDQSDEVLCCAKVTNHFFNNIFQSADKLNLVPFFSSPQFSDNFCRNMLSIHPFYDVTKGTSRLPLTPQVDGGFCRTPIGCLVYVLFQTCRRQSKASTVEDTKKKLFSGDQLESWLIVHTILDSCSTAVQSRKNTQQIRSRTGLHNTTKDTTGSATLHCSTSEPFSYLTVKSVDFRAWEQNPCRPGHEDSDVTQQVPCEKLQVRFTLVSRNKTKKEGSSDGWTLDFQDLMKQSVVRLVTPCWRSDKQAAKLWRVNH